MIRVKKKKEEEEDRQEHGQDVYTAKRKHFPPWPSLFKKKKNQAKARVRSTNSQCDAICAHCSGRMAQIRDGFNTGEYCLCNAVIIFTHGDAGGECTAAQRRSVSTETRTEN